MKCYVNEMNIKWLQGYHDVTEYVIYIYCNKERMLGIQITEKSVNVAVWWNKSIIKS